MKGSSREEILELSFVKGSAQRNNTRAWAPRDLIQTQVCLRMEAHRGPDGGTGPSQCLWVLSPGGCSEDAPSDFFLNSPQLSKDSLSPRLCIQVTMVTTLAAADTSWGRGHVSAVKNHML